MASKDEFLQWFDHHVELFALSEADAKTVALWRPSLDGVSLTDLMAISSELLQAAPKSFRNEHVQMFFRLLAKRRRTVYRSQATTCCTCKTCRGEANIAEESAPFSFKVAAKRYEEAKKTNEKVPF